MPGSRPWPGSTRGCPGTRLLRRTCTRRRATTRPRHVCTPMPPGSPPTSPNGTTSLARLPGSVRRCGPELRGRPYARSHGRLDPVSDLGLHLSRELHARAEAMPDRFTPATPSIASRESASATATSIPAATGSGVRSTEATFPGGSPNRGAQSGHSPIARRCRPRPTRSPGSSDRPRRSAGHERGELSQRADMVEHRRSGPCALLDDQSPRPQVPGARPASPEPPPAAPRMPSSPPAGCRPGRIPAALGAYVVGRPSPVTHRTVANPSCASAWSSCSSGPGCDRDRRG